MLKQIEELIIHKIYVNKTENFQICNLDQNYSKLKENAHLSNVIGLNKKISTIMLAV